VALPIAANRWPAARGLLRRRSREFSAAPPDVSRPAWRVGRRSQRSADRLGLHADCERADLGAKPESGCSEPSASTQVAAIHGDGIIHAGACRDRMALDPAGSRRAWGYALNESRFPGARTGGEETETVCASKPDAAPNSKPLQCPLSSTLLTDRAGLRPRAFRHERLQTHRPGKRK
jgi:hypothetical protein